MRDELPGDESSEETSSAEEAGAHRAPRTPRQKLVAWLQPAGAAVLLLLIASTIVWPKLNNASSETTSESPRVPQVSPSYQPHQTTTTSGDGHPAPRYEVVPGSTIAVDHHFKEKKLRKKAQKKVVPPLTFRIASFNVLGASHTARHGNKPSYNDGAARMGVAVDLLRAQDVDVVGFQEFEPTQYYSFHNRTGSAWGVYPGMSLGSRGVRNSVAWNTATWEAVETHTATIPYFRGNRALIPYVLLRNPETGREAWFISIHNPTSNAKRGNNQGFRNAATNIERNLMTQLGADGTPVFLSGDFNERNEAFCKMTYGGVLQSASGGSGGPPCLLPPHLGIDWIFSTPDVEFSSYLRYQTPTVHRVSDHPMILANATISGE